MENGRNVNNRIDIKVSLENGDWFVTGFNGTFEEAKKYYVDECFEAHDESVHKCIKIELV